MARHEPESRKDNHLMIYLAIAGIAVTVFLAYRKRSEQSEEPPTTTEQGLPTSIPVGGGGGGGGVTPNPPSAPALEPKPPAAGEQTTRTRKLSDTSVELAIGRHQGHGIVTPTPSGPGNHGHLTG